MRLRRDNVAVLLFTAALRHPLKAYQTATARLNRHARWNSALPAIVWTVMVYFGPFEFDPGTHELRRDDTPVPLERQPAMALDLLVSRRGRLVPREEIRRAIWPQDVHVDFDRGMNYCIRQLRAALEDDARHPRYIETVPRQGYRFVGTVQQPCAPGAVALPAPRDRRARAFLA